MAQSVYRADAEAAADFRQRRRDVLKLRQQAAIRHVAQGHSARLLRVRHAPDERRQARTQMRPRGRSKILRDVARLRRDGENSTLRGAVAGNFRRARRFAGRRAVREGRQGTQERARDRCGGRGALSTDGEA